ncbi:MAG: tRNA (adenosine(37)-N6)-dimethylallyltransferase MiaA [Candidatus Omnitrophica bacterium]|nr:tRNA (adenosine(37)-N6)-dimethylallyltransferase MiaA [Candidatus Omnitrophota bacterium]
MKPRIVFLVGPTAVGKSEVGVILAEKINAEIISCDSMQVYKEMDILTSKPNLALRRRVSHHLIDIVYPTKEYDVFQYRKMALKKIKEILKKNKTPLFVGGSGLYMSVVIDGIFQIKTKDSKVRAFLYQQAKDFGALYLYKRLKEIDPESASRIHPHDTKRIIRALEVFEITGKPISYLQKKRKGLDNKYEIKIFGLRMGKELLLKRIQKRVEQMFKLGLITEVKNLLKQPLSRTASCAIGLKEIKGYLEGLYDLEKTKELLTKNTYYYARKQMTWFRKDKRITWIDLKAKERPQEIAEKIWRELS